MLWMLGKLDGSEDGCGVGRETMLIIHSKLGPSTRLVKVLSTRESDVLDN